MLTVLILDLHCCRIDVRKYISAERVTCVWNNLPANEARFSDLAVLKKFIRNVDFKRLVSLDF